MFVSLSIHQPRPGKEEELLEAMTAFDECMKRHEGFREGHLCIDAESKKIIGIVTWDSRGHFLGAFPEVLRETKARGIDPSGLEEGRGTLYQLTAVRDVHS